MTGILEMFRDLSEPDFYDVSAQLELFVWRVRAAARERAARRAAIVRVVPALREARNAYHRSRSASRREYWRAYRARRYATDPVYRARIVASQAKRDAAKRAARQAV